MIKKIRQLKISQILPIIILAIVLTTPVATAQSIPNSPPSAGGAPAKSLWDIVTINAKGASGSWFIAFLDTIFNAFSILAGWAGKLMDMSIDYSLGGGNMGGQSFYKAGIVMNGWEICRNLTNLFFIFILIYIGIATILQLSTYHYKSVLVGVIIAALLVNFSLVITKIVVDASNVLAMEFLCKMSGGECRAGGGLVRPGGENKSITATLANGLSMHTFFGEGRKCLAKNADGTCQQYEAINKVQSNLKLTLDKVILVYIFGSMLMLIVAFIFLAGAGFFLVRTVALMFLMILSPLAFAAMAFKGGGGATGGYSSSKWWDELFKQSFFAPIYLFLLYIIVSFVGGVQSITGSSGKSFMSLIVNNDTGNLAIAVQFLIMAIMLIAALNIAKSMSGAGGGYVMTAANWVKKQAQGYAGKGAKYATGWSAGKLEQSKAMQWAAKIPIAGKATQLATRPLAKLADARQKDIENAAKKYMKYSPASLASIFPTLSSNVQKSIIGQMKDDKLGEMMGKMSDSNKLKYGKILMNKDEKTGTKFAKTINNVELGAKIIGKADAATNENVKKFLDSLDQKQLQGIDMEKAGDSDVVFETVLSSIAGKDFSKMITPKNIEKTSKGINKYADRKGFFKDPGHRAGQLTQKVDDLNNKSLGKYLRTSPIIQIISEPTKVIFSRGDYRTREEKKEETKEEAPAGAKK